MVPQSKPPASPMLARAKFLTSRSRRTIEAQMAQDNGDNVSGKNVKTDDNTSVDGTESPENSNKKNIIDRIRSVVSSSPQNVSTHFQPVLPPPTTANKIGRFFSLKSGGFFGGKSNLMDTVPSGSNTSLNSINDPKERGIKSKKTPEEAKTLQEQQDKKGLQRRGSLKGNKANTRDRSNDNLGNGNRKSFVLQSQGKTAREEGVKQSGAFYTLNKAGDKTPGAESRKIPVGVVHNARGNNIKNLGEKDVRKDIESMRDNIPGTSKEKV
jgi:hypothetical protein